MDHAKGIGAPLRPPARLECFRFGFAAMGSPCELQLYAPDAVRARLLGNALRAEVERLEQRYSRYRPDSELATLNAVAAAGGEAEVDEEMAALLHYADTCFHESGGLFDVTSGVLREIWNLREGVVPSRALVESLLPRIGWQRVRWQRPRIGFAPGMELDFGGIVKEYAADRLATMCQEAGCRHALVNLGGDIRVVGPHPDGAPWTIGIRHPRASEGGGFPAGAGTLRLESGAVTTSGDYERCLVVDGRRHGHVFNPRTGWPVSHLASVSVIADHCVVAGSASTIAMLKEQAGPAWLRQLGVPHLWIDTRGRAGGPLAPDSTVSGKKERYTWTG